ncbi:uncharacterized protein YbjT (DUF2867 family) [Saccharothrix saharensis]|uniref:Uncharacterized protein YbjT (DUF2867 family) n=1 Tax=Saccharothrix saharensis TaxID=571190 RepID=A0A543JDZ9_9PSEU|nr:NmrA/HSCARG family protein [Saccharothrix saharensis]TQM80994.1 uncharacterized protein YbjT (DUF2867 family) [Saccharothrix saharensis]
MKPILVTGATGAQGGAVTRALLARGHRVRALTRAPHSVAAQELHRLGADVVPGDYDDPASLRTALHGVRAVFAVTTPFGSDTATETRHGITLVDAARDVEHIVFTSASNADRGTGVPHFDSKQRIEEHLVTAGPRWTILGPAAFLDDKFGGWTVQGLREGILYLPLPSDRALHLIAVRDVAAAAVLAFEQPDRFAGRRLDLAGESLTPAGMATALTAAIGQPIRHHCPPLHVVARHSTDLAAMFAYFTDVGTDIDLRRLHAELPEITWTGYADFVRTLPWPDLLRTA